MTIPTLTKAALIKERDVFKQMYQSIFEDYQKEKLEHEQTTTALKLFQSILESSETKLKVALESMTDAIFISDRQGNFIDFNEAFATFHKFKNKEECAKTLKEYPLFLDVYKSDGVLANLEDWAVPRALRGETASNQEYMLHRKDTGETWIGSYSLAPIRDTNGEIVGSVVTGRDITKQKRAEEQVKELNKSLELRVKERTLQLSEVNSKLADELKIREQAESELKENQANLAAVFNATYESVFLISTDLTVLAMNDMAANRLGKNPESVIGKKINKFLPPELLKYRLPILNQVIATGEPITFEDERRGHWMMNSIFPVKDESGKVIRISIFARDITDRKKAEETLRENETRYRLITENATDVIWVQDLETFKFRYVSPSFERLLGYSAEFVMMNQMVNLLTPNSFAYLSIAIPERIERFKNGFSEIYTDELEHIHKNGSIVWVQINTQIMLNPANGKLEATGVAHDITDRKQAEEALMESEMRLKEVLENSLDASYKRNLSTGTYDYISPVFDKITGYTQKEMKALDISEVLGLIYADDRIKIDHVTAESLADTSGKSFQVEYRFKHKDGEIRWLLNQFIVIRDNNGQAIAHIGSVRDINEQKKAEDALKAEEVIKTDLLKKLNEAQHNAKIGSLDWNLVSKQVWWSDELYRIFELDPETFTPSVESNSKYVHPDDTEEFHKEAFRIIETKEELDYDLRIITANGNLKHCNIRAKTECNSAGNPLRFYGTFSDITERKKVEADLLNASLYNRSLIEASIDPLVTIGHDGRIMDVNRATEQFTGVNCETLIGSEFSNYYTEPNKAKHGYLQVLEQGKVTDYPLTMQHISGRTFDVLYNATIYKNADGSVAGVFAAARDITERKLAEKALDESRKLYKLLAENSTDGVSMIDADGKVIYVSPAYLRRLGYTEEDWIGADTIGILNQLHPDDTGRIGAEIKRGRKLKLPTTKYEYRVRTKSGEYIWLEDVLHREFDSDGRFVHTIVNSRIITERKLSEQLLLESEEKYKRIFSTERDSMFLIDQETGSFLDFNDAACELYGYSRDEMFNLKTYDLSAEQEETKRAMHYLNDWNEFRNHRKKDGTIFPVDISASHFTWKGKSVLLTAIRDISSFKRIEHSLQTSNDRYDKLTSTIPVGVYVLNNKLDGTTAFEYISSKVPELIGVDIENLKADAFLLIKFIHPDDKESFMKLVKEEFRTTLNQLDWKGRFVVDGKTKWLQIISTPEMLENGDISRHGLIIDITENVLAEADIQSKNDELAKSLSEKDKFFSIIAHDLRSPFNGLLGFTTMLSEDLPDLNMEQIQTIADLLKKSATNAYNLVVNLLEWSQMQRGITVFNPEQFYLILKIKEILQALLEQAHKKGIQINSQIPENLVIFADLNMISSTIRNLVSNAIKFTPKGGRIVISAISGSGGCTEIKVKDNGIGMSQSLISKLFVLAENTGRKGTDNEPSSGLGLNLCKEFVEKHGGKIWAESEEGNGSTFHFTLPEPGFGGDL